MYSRKRVRDFETLESKQMLAGDGIVAPQEAPTVTKEERAIPPQESDGRVEGELDLDRPGSTEDEFGVTWEQVARHHFLGKGNGSDNGQIPLEKAFQSLEKQLTVEGEEGFGKLRDQLFAETARENADWISEANENVAGVGSGTGVAASSESSGSCGSLYNTLHRVERKNTGDQWVTVNTSDWTWNTDDFRIRSTWAGLPANTTIYNVEYQYREWDYSTGSWDPWTVLGTSSQASDYPLELTGMPWGRYQISPKATMSGQCYGEAWGPTRNLKVAAFKNVFFVGVDPGDGSTNLSADNPSAVPGDTFPGGIDFSYDMGGGYRFFHGKNTESGPLHDKVKVKVEISPNESGIPVALSLVDADDPTAHDNDIDDDDESGLVILDNRGAATIANSATTVASGSGNASVASTDLTVSQARAGDNFRVIVGQRDDKILRILPYNISSEYGGEILGRTFYDKNGNFTYDIGDTIGSETIPTKLTESNYINIGGNVFFSTPLLSVWKELNVEVDKMVNETLADTSAFASAFKKAYVSVKVHTNTANNNLPNTPVYSHDPDNVDLENSNDYWAAYLVGVHNASSDTPPPIGQTSSDGWSAVSNHQIEIEPIWTGVQDSVRKTVALHEVGHWFINDGPNQGHSGNEYPGLPLPDHVMSSPVLNDDLPDRLNRFRATDIDKIRRHPRPLGPMDP